MKSITRGWRIVLALCAALCTVDVVVPAMASESAPPQLGSVTKLPVPRYVSLRSSEINVRRGPGLDYRKDWVFRRAGLPVRVIEEYGDWRRIVDKDDAGGWVFHAMITGRRTALITQDLLILRKEPSETAEATAQAEIGVVARLKACERNWCEIEQDGHAGWVPKDAIWGVEPNEEFTR